MTLFTTHYRFKCLGKQLLAACFDAMGAILFFPARFFQKPLDFQTVQKILVIRMDHIGDVVMTRPAIRALHKKFPHAAIDLLVTQEIAPLLHHSKEIQNVLATPCGWLSRHASFLQKSVEFWRLLGILRKKRYDLGIDFRGDVRNILLMSLAGIRHTIGYGITGGGFLLSENFPYDTAQHQIKLNLNLLASFHVAPDNKLLPFEYPAEKAQNLWQKFGQRPPTTVLPRVIVHMDAGTSSKKWAPDNFCTLIRKIDREALAQIILIGTQAEKEALPDLKIRSERFIDLRGETVLEDLPILFDVCDLFIGNDSGPAHLAAAQGLEIVLLASGTNDIRHWYPWTERLSLLQYEVPCSPCEEISCPVPEHPCMENITVDQAFDAFQSVVNRLQKQT